MPHLFSYGTLQLPRVQQDTFGRHLAGTPDTLTGWVERRVEITDPAVLQSSGETHHPILVPGNGPPIPGTVFELTNAELARADAYEVADYARTLLTLASGRNAFVYVGATHAREPR